MFKGHQFIKLINENWVLDITEFQGYKVKLDDNGEVIDYKKAFTAKVDNNDVKFDKYMRVPLKVLKEACNQIMVYEAKLGDKN